MEGKSVLFKRFADVNSIDLEVDTEDPDAFCNAVRLLGPSFGGINLEDIKAPECFIIEQRLKEEMDIPVFHDDQHGTAVICAAGLINALHLTGKKIENVKVVLNGAGAAGIACLELLKRPRRPPRQLPDVRHQGRHLPGPDRGHEPVEVRPRRENRPTHARGGDARCRRLPRRLGQGRGHGQMVASMAPDPVIFAMANPDPEITPRRSPCHPRRCHRRHRALGLTPTRSTTSSASPYLFRGALDIHARAINDEMKLACAEALAALAREAVPDEVALAYGRKLTFAATTSSPPPSTPRLIHRIPPLPWRSAG